MQEEIWKPFYCHKDYEISNLGRVRRSSFFLKIDTSDKCGYSRISVRILGKPKHFSIHRLVAIAFIPNPLNLPQVNHKDTDKSNNNLANLEWVSAKDNMAHAYQNGLVHICRGEELSDFTTLDIQLIRAWRSVGCSIREVQSIYKMSQAQISRICSKTRWQHVSDLQDV